MQNKEYTIGEVLEFPIGTEFTIKDGGIVKIVGCDNDKNCKILNIIHNNHGTYEVCKLTNLWLKKKFKLKNVEADERTITKDTSNGEIVPNIDINIYGECENPEDIANAFKENFKKLFNPVDNAAETLKAHERTVRDCILDMIIQEKIKELKKKFLKYLNSELDELHKKVQKCSVNQATIYTDDYKKLVRCRKDINNMSTKDLLDCSEKDICQFMGFGPNKTFDYLIEDVNYTVEFEKEKDDEQSI